MTLADLRALAEGLADTEPIVIENYPVAMRVRRMR